MRPDLYGDDDPMMAYQQAMMRRGGQPRRFDEYFRCYPVVMLPGPVCCLQRFCTYIYTDTSNAQGW